MLRLKEGIGKLISSLRQSDAKKEERKESFCTLLFCMVKLQE